ncbi:MAG TPA: hypothetical protein VF458_18955 [Ktedonobacteraceae bacterium]
MDLAQEPPCPNIGRRQKKLTPEQEAYARQFARERVTAMLEPEVDEQAAEDHLRRAYQVAGLAPPRIRWFDSPVAFNQAREMASKTEQVQDQEAKGLWDDMQACVTRLQVSMGFLPQRVFRRRLRWVGIVQVAGYLALGGAMVLLSHWLPRRGWLWWMSLMLLLAVLFLWAWIWKRVTKRLRRGRHSRERESIWMCLDRQVDAALHNRLMWPWDLLPAIDGGEDEDSIWNQTAWRCIRAYTEQGQLTVCWFLHDVFEPNRLIHLARFNELVSGYDLGHKLAWLVRKPIRIQQDADGLLHAGSGKCLEYRDGWGVYAWHGVVVPERVIVQPETLTREDWLNERNLEVRRVMQERMPNFVETIGAQWLETGKYGSLYAVDLAPDPEEVAHYVHVQDSSSAHSYYLRVPPTIHRADEAVAWTFGLSEQEYQPAQEA